MDSNSPPGSFPLDTPPDPELETAATANGLVLIADDQSSTTSHVSSGRPNSQDAGFETPVSSHSSSRSGDDHRTKFLSAIWTEREENEITRPFDYIMGQPGKNFRTQVLSAFNVWLQVDQASLDIIDRAIGILHNASLLIDDIQDGSELRRGVPAAHCVFGTAQTINSANYAYFLAQQELYLLERSHQAVQVFVEELLNLHRGQGIELYWRDTLTVPTEDEYLLMISNKTGGLFRLAARLMQVVSTVPCDVIPLSELIGLIFQIRDDYQNLCSEQMASAKGFCEDITEGKFSLPVIHAIRSSSTANNEILNILRLRTSSTSLKSHACWYMQTQTKSLDYTKMRLEHFYRCAEAELERVQPPNDMMKKLLEKLRISEK